MAKRYDNDFDAEGFVENFRAQDDTPATSVSTNSVEMPDSDSQSRKKKSNPTQPGQEQPSDMAESYKATFLDNLKYRFPSNDWPLIKISPVFKAKIILLELICGTNRANLSTFINNVLEQHFRDYDAHIKELEKKYKK